MPTNRPEYYLDWRNHIVNNLGNECVLCGSTLFLEIHHEDEIVRGKGRGSLARLTEWKRELEKEEEYCLILLCKRCHDLLHIIRLMEGDKN